MSEILHRTLAEEKARLVSAEYDPQLKAFVMLTREWPHIDARYHKTIIEKKNTDSRFQNPYADQVQYNGSYYRAGPLEAIGTNSRSVTIRERLVKGTGGREWSYTHAVNWGETRTVKVVEDLTYAGMTSFISTYATPTNGKFYSINVSRGADYLWNVTVTERTGVAGEAEWDFPTKYGTGHRWWGANKSTGTFSALINNLVDGDSNSYSIGAYEISHTHTPKNEYDLENYTITAVPRDQASWDFNDTSTHYYSYIEKQPKKNKPNQSGLSDNPADGFYWRTVIVKFEQKFSFTNTGALNHVNGGLVGSEIKQRSSSDDNFVSIKIISYEYGDWQEGRLPSMDTTIVIQPQPPEEEDNE